MKISFIVGTRPELIKLAPLIIQFINTDIKLDIVNTAQHKDLLDPYWKTFGITPTYTLDVMVPGQGLSSLTSRAINEIQSYIDSVPERPDVIFAQGDTTTVMAASLICFYNNIKFAHLEAGLRSHDLHNPYPEELNRRIASIVADYHFCPTEISKQNLLNEGVAINKIYVVGNTVVDSLKWIISREKINSTSFQNVTLNKVNTFEKCVLVTCHRRENQGKNLLSIIQAVYDLAHDSPKTIFIWTLHPNPQVKNIVMSSSLKEVNNVLLTDPLEYLDLLSIMSRSVCIISDSGGIQEEAPSFSTPVIVLRDTTERPEGVNEGLAFLAGADKNKISYYFNFINQSPISFSNNPYGDGKSCERIRDIIVNQVV